MKVWVEIYGLINEFCTLNKEYYDRFYIFHFISLSFKFYIEILFII